MEAAKAQEVDGLSLVEESNSEKEQSAFWQAASEALTQLDNLVGYVEKSAQATSDATQREILSATDEILDVRIPLQRPIGPGLPSQAISELASFALRLLGTFERQTVSWLSFTREVIRKIDSAWTGNHPSPEAGGEDD